MIIDQSMMKVGDLVVLRHCAQAGMTGIITMQSQPSYMSEPNPALWLYWVLCDLDVKCFTGDQLALV